uniref:Uncharacterized protein n=1 Tax=Romanomermis culicivorax TaxID=13658 RepID=A0A915JVM2_ROMCU
MKVYQVLRCVMLNARMAEDARVGNGLPYLRWASELTGFNPSLGLWSELKQSLADFAPKRQRKKCPYTQVFIGCIELLRIEAKFGKIENKQATPIFIKVLLFKYHIDIISVCLRSRCSKTATQDSMRTKAPTAMTHGPA